MKPLKIVFYTEAGSQRGMGHLIRCYCLYEQFKHYRIKGSFFLDSDIDYSYKFSDISPFTWDSFRMDDSYDIVVIDSYEAPVNIYHLIANSTRIPVFIDDYGRLNYPEGTIVNFAPDAEELFYSIKNPKSQYLLGVDYVPLRREILTSKETKENQIFIMLGGNDIYNLSPTILEAIQDIQIKKVIVINNEDIAETLSSYSNIKVLYKPSDEVLITEMNKSILAISTASMSLYELAYLKIPTIIFSLSENQKIGSNQLLKYHLASWLIDIGNPHWANDLKKYITTFNTLNINPSIDGLGAQRIVEFITRMAKK